MPESRGSHESPGAPGPAPRSYLYAPGSRPDVLRKALRAGADAVILDLEDAVVPGEKVTARRHVADLLAELADGLGAELAAERTAERAGRPPCQVHVRINRTDTGFDLDDLRAVVGPALTALRLPKVESADQVRFLAEVLSERESRAGLAAGSVGLYPVVESARGVFAAGSIAAAPRVIRLGLGVADLLADVGARGDGGSLTDHARAHLVLAGRAAGAGAPVDSVFTDLHDTDGLRRQATAARDLGFSGKSVLHPRQVPVVNEVFAPGAEELAEARAVLAAAELAARRGVGALTVDGRFVDEAVVARARALIAMAQEDDHVG